VPQPISAIEIGFTNCIIVNYLSFIGDY